MPTFVVLPSINSAEITAARRGKAVEKYYSDLIGTIAVKFALNAGAKNLIHQAIAATQSTGPGGFQRDPKTGTLKSDLIHVLRAIEVANLGDSAARSTQLSHADRQSSAHQFATAFVHRFMAVRAAKN